MDAPKCLSYSIWGFTNQFKASGSNNVFVDTASSLEWSESALDVSTCLAPSHSVYSVKLHRYLLAVEHLSLQGIWRCDAEKPSAFDAMLRKTSLARDLAGNSFSGTVARAAFLTSLVCSDVWRDVGVKSPVKENSAADSPAEPAQQREQPAQKRAQPAQPSHRPSKRAKSMIQPPEDHEVAEAGEPSAPSQEKPDEKPLDKKRKMKPAGPPGGLVPTHRLRKKTTLAPKPPKPPRGHATTGNQKARGKKKMATLAEKEAIMSAYDEAVKSGQKQPIQAVKHFRGFFPGCVYESKWGKIRREQKWSIFVHTAPKLCEKFKELPNCLRRVINIKNKGASRELPCKRGGKNASLPEPLQEFVEQTILERLELGEEMGIHFVKQTILLGVELWNEVVPKLTA